MGGGPALESMKPSRPRKVLTYGISGFLAFIVLAVFVTHQFPSLTSSPKTSVEILEELFKAPLRVTTDPRQFVLARLKREAVVLFVKSADLPEEAEARIVALVRGEQFKDVTVPFVYYLYDLYGSSLGEASGDFADLAYEEPPPPPTSGESSGGFSLLALRSPRVKKHISTSLLVFDALFLRERPEAGDEDIKRVIREAVAGLLSQPGESLSGRPEEAEMRAALGKFVEDDRKLTAFVEFFSDFIRQLSDSWLRSFVRRERRKEERKAWVEACLADNRYYAIADYARSRAERRIVLHVAVDGLQGKLLEGLAQLSSGNREGSGARYLEDLVRLHREAGHVDPDGTWVGKDLQALVAQAPDRPEYLPTFKKYFFAPEAEAVAVSVATVDTPSISVRNLPIIFSGHPVAGPHGTGIPNFSYLDRRTGRGFYFWGSDILYLRDIFGNREEAIPGGANRTEGPGARTLFQRLWRYNTASCMAQIDTGALEKISAEVGVAIGEVQRNFIEKVILVQFRERARMERELNVRRAWLMERRGLSRSFLGSLFLDAVELKTFHEYAQFLAEHDDEGIPDYTLWFNPWPDHYAHGRGPYSDAIVGFRGEYDRLDFYLGKMFEIYTSVESVDGASTYLDRTLFGLVSDHGLVATPEQLSTDALLFDAMKKDGIDIRYLKLTQDEGALPAIHGRNDIKPTRPYDAVVGSTAGGSYIIDLFDPEDWQRHPGYHELRNHRLLSGAPIDWIETLRVRLGGKLDLALIREYGPGPNRSWSEEVDSVVRMVTPSRGEARIVRLRNGPLYRYELLGEEDPLDLAGAVREYLIPPDGPSLADVKKQLGEWVRDGKARSDAEWAEPLSYTLRPDVVRQFSQLYDSERAGTVNVFPSRFVGFNTTVPGRHAGEAFGEKNGTQLYRGAGLKKARLQTARNGSLPVTLYHWLGGDEAPRDGFGYRSLLDEAPFAPLRR